MRPRNPEAARLEADHLDRLAALLAGREADAAADLYLGVKDRIEAELATLPGDEVTLVQMASVLERLGPPGTFVTSAETKAGPDREEGPPPVVPPVPASLRPGPDIAPGAPDDRPGHDGTSLIARYFEGTRHYSRTRFILEMALVAIPLKGILGVLWAVVSGMPGPSTTEANDHGNGFALFLNACALAPLLETLIGQWLPLWIASWFTRKTAWRVAFSAVLFSALHLYVGFTGFLTILPVGILLAWSFAVKRERSWWEAYWVTGAIHAVHNFVTLFIYYAVK